MTKATRRRHEVARTLEKCGHSGYGLHGLRFKAARRLAEIGCDLDDIAAITGHRTAAMARVYSTRAERASKSITRLDAERDKNKFANGERTGLQTALTTTKKID